MDTEYKFFADRFPDTPGVYLMKDGRGRILYVGKAKKLRRRLASYFRNPAGQTPKTRALVARIRHIDTLLTATEKEALLLESGLIKKHRPRYNVVLKDDKQYVLFRLDRQNEFPRLSMTRKVVRDGSVYFGPFTSASAARTVWKLLGKVFPLRKCKDTAFRNRVRPCLYHDIGQCWAPCVKDVDREEYAEMVHRVEMLLSGRSLELVDDLTRKMKTASRDMEFERAAEYRDQIRAVKKTVEGQAAVIHDNRDRDIVGIAENAQGLGLGLLFVRQGRLLDQKQFFWPGLTLEEGPEVVDSFIGQFYGVGRFIPSTLVVPMDLEESPLPEILTERGRAQRAYRHPAQHPGKTAARHRPQCGRAVHGSPRDHHLPAAKGPAPPRGAGAHRVRGRFAPGRPGYARGPGGLRGRDGATPRPRGSMPSPTWMGRATTTRLWLAGRGGAWSPGRPGPIWCSSTAAGARSRPWKRDWPSAPRNAAGSWPPSPRARPGARASWVM